MAITLGHNQYGKAEVRVVRVNRDDEPSRPEGPQRRHRPSATSPTCT